MRSRVSSALKVQSTLVVALVAWGALAFGGVYRWGYLTLAPAAALAGMIGLCVGSGWRRVPKSILFTFAALIVAILFQEIPLPHGVLERISPAAVTIIAQRDIAFETVTSVWHPLSIDPARTWTGLVLAGSLGVLWLGLIATLNERVIQRLCGGIVAIGLGLAVIGIAGLANHDGKVLGFWQPLTHAAPFGPFINRNHYAGWMLMTVPLGIGYLMAMITREFADRPPARSWGARIAWLSTRRANVIIILALALTMMSLSVLVSLSRSGIACLSIGLAVFGGLALRSIATRSRRAVIAGGIAILATGCVGWAGLDRLGSRFAEFQTDRSGGRQGIWRDALTVARTFPFAGTGLDTFGVSMVFYQTTDPNQHYEEAHNDYLQIAAEGGLLVGLPAVALLGVTAGLVWRRFRNSVEAAPAVWLRAGAVAGLLTIALQEITEFSLQMPGNAALFAVLAAIAVYPSSPRDRERAVTPFNGPMRSARTAPPASIP
jgi:O-antigen ligase/polysaccharide polymerase Wzy-like membrane protein